MISSPINLRIKVYEFVFPEDVTLMIKLSPNNNFASSTP